MEEHHGRLSSHGPQQRCEESQWGQEGDRTDVVRRNETWFSRRLEQMNTAGSAATQLDRLIRPLGTLTCTCSRCTLIYLKKYAKYDRVFSSPIKQIDGKPIKTDLN